MRKSFDYITDASDVMRALEDEARWEVWLVRDDEREVRSALWVAAKPKTTEQKKAHD